MYAIIRTGGRQHRAEIGKTLDVDRLPNPVNDSITITDVLLVGDGDNTVNLLRSFMQFFLFEACTS